MSKTAPEVIILVETTTQSLIRSAGSIGSVAAMIWLGVILDSAAMQWIGGVFGFFAIVGFAKKLMDSNQMTISQARARLDEIERRA